MFLCIYMCVLCRRQSADCLNLLALKYEIIVCAFLHMLIVYVYMQSTHPHKHIVHTPITCMLYTGVGCQLVICLEADFLPHQTAD